MKVVLANSFAAPKGGAEEHVATCERLLRGAGHEVRTYVPVERDGLRGAIDRFENRKVRSEFGDLLDAFQPDIVHIHNFFRTLSTAAFDVAISRGLPTVWTAHDFQMVCPRTWGIRSDGRPCPEPKLRLCLFGSCRGSLEGWSGRVIYAANRFRTASAARTVGSKTTTITAPSRELADRLGAELRRETTHLPYPFPPVEEPTSSDRELDLLFVGRLGAEKGLDRVLRAMAEVDGLTLTVAGSGPAHDEWRRLAIELGLEDRIQWLGWVDPKSLPDLRARHRALVVPSLWLENSPLVVHDALASGLPVLCSRRGGLPELVEHGVEGLLFEPEDHDAIVEVLESWSRLTDEDWQVFSDRARQRATRPTEHAFLDLLLGVYAQAVNR